MLNGEGSAAEIESARAANGSCGGSAIDNKSVAARLYHSGDRGHLSVFRKRAGAVSEGHGNAGWRRTHPEVG